VNKMKNFRLKRSVKPGTYPLLEVAAGLEQCRTLWKVFGSKARAIRILSQTKLHVSRKPWMAWVNDKKGEVNISGAYLRKAPRRQLYLDLVHELVHIKQWHDGKELWDKSYSYQDRPTEIEAYKVTSEEAKKLGMSKKQIVEYLKVPWIRGNSEKQMMRNILGENYA